MAIRDARSVDLNARRPTSTTLRTALHALRLRRAGNGTRTRDIQLGKLTLYQLSYSRGQENIDVEMPGVEPGSEVENPKPATCVFDL